MLFQLPFLPELMLRNFAKEIWEEVMDRGELPKDDEMRNYAEQEVIDIMAHGINLYRANLRTALRPPPQVNQMPVCLMGATYDLAIDPSSYEHHKDFFPNLEKHLIAGNHWIHRQRPSEVNGILERFLESGDGG